MAWHRVRTPAEKERRRIYDILRKNGMNAKQRAYHLKKWQEEQMALVNEGLDAEEWADAKPNQKTIKEWETCVPNCPNSVFNLGAFCNA